MSAVAIVLAVVIVVFIVLTAASRPRNANHAGLRIEQGRSVREPAVIRVPLATATYDGAPALLVVILQIAAPRAVDGVKDEERPLAA